jgi:hypothetical protein
MRGPLINNRSSGLAVFLLIFPTEDIDRSQLPKAIDPYFKRPINPKCQDIALSRPDTIAHGLLNREKKSNVISRGGT